jgi:hypothetical protein
MNVASFGTLPWYEVSLLALIVFSQVYGVLLLLSLAFPRWPQGKHHQRRLVRR